MGAPLSPDEAAARARAKAQALLDKREAAKAERDKAKADAKEQGALFAAHCKDAVKAYRDNDFEAANTSLSRAGLMLKGGGA